VPRNIVDIKNLILGNSLARKHANYFYPGSMIDSLASDVGRLLVDAETEHKLAMKNMYVASAEGQGLERIANDYGLSRSMDATARALASDRNILISTTYNENLSDVLAAYNININGLQVTNANDTIRYILQQTDAIGPEDKSIYVGAIANGSGSFFNVDKGALNRFVKSFPRLKVTNLFSIRTGKNVETDESLRLKIFSKIESNQKTISSLNYLINQELPDLGSLAVAGDTGGTSGLIIYLQPATGLFYEDSVLSNIKFLVSSFVGPGQIVKVSNFTSVGFRFEIHVIVKAGLNATSVSDQVQRIITNYFNQLRPGASVELDSLKFSILGIPGVKLVSKTSNNFKKVEYQVQDGTAYFKYDASLLNTVDISPNQLATLSNLELSVTNE
jgi:hypothetical protein